MAAPSRLHRHAEGLWTADGGPIPFWAPPIPVRFSYALRMVIVRLGDGSLWVDSPLAPDDDLFAEVDALGPVQHIVSPNKLHHLYMGDWARRFADARLWASPGLPDKRPDLTFADVLGSTPPPAWADVLDQQLVRGSAFMQEVVFFHRRSRTLILGDLVENHDPAVLGPVQRLFARVNCMLAPNGETPRNFRLSFVHRADTREDLRRIFAWHPQRAIMMHGPIFETDVMPRLRRAFAWAGLTHVAS